MPVSQPPFQFAGHSLNRPECVIGHSSGVLLVPDWTGNGGISVIFPDGAVKRHLVRDAPFPLRPNGIALLDGGDVLLVHLGAEDGGVWRLKPDGTVDLEIGEADGSPLPPSNFCHVDQHDRRWLSVSTRHIPRASAYNKNVCDGFIVLADQHGARIVADDLGYTNECLVHPDGQRLFVNETFSRRLTAFDISGNGDLKNRRTITEFSAGTFPDGMAFDENGETWIVSIVSNRVIRVDGQGRQSLVFEDADPEFVTVAEEAYLAGEMGRPHLDNNPASNLRNISSMAFDGVDRRRIVFGCLLGDRLPFVQAPVAGWTMPHFHFDIAPLLRALDTIPALVNGGENKE